MAEYTFSLTEDQALIGQTVRDFLATESPMERVRQVMMTETGFDSDLWKKMSDLGWAGMAVSEDMGGLGLGWVELASVLEEMGRANASGPFFAVVNAAAAIEDIAPPDKARPLLDGIVTGSEVTTLGIWEHSRDLAVNAPELTGTRLDTSRWSLEGSKTHVIYGHVADRLLVTARTKEGLGLFDVPVSQPGVDVTLLEAMDPTRPLAAVSFDGVEIPEERWLPASEGALERLLDRVVTLMAVEQLGGAQSCLEMAVDYAKSRYQFGRPIGSYQAVKHRCAQMLVRVESSRSAAYHAVRVLDDDDERPVAAPLASSLCSESFAWVAGENIQVHGGIGFTWEHDAHIYLKRAKASSQLFGSPTMQRDRMGRALDI